MAAGHGKWLRRGSDAASALRPAVSRVGPERKHHPGNVPVSRLEKFRFLKLLVDKILLDASAYIKFSETTDKEAGDILYEGALRQLKLATEEMESLCAD